LEKTIANGQSVAGVQADTVEAIHAVRKIGNIGAHMEEDVDRIIEVEPEEAQALINLIELLLDEWYVARHKREEKIAQVTAVAAAKEEQKNI